MLFRIWKFLLVTVLTLPDLTFAATFLCPRHDLNPPPLGCPDFVLTAKTHPLGYTGTGGTISLSVCLTPGSPSAAFPVLQRVVSTWNQLSPAFGNLEKFPESGVPIDQQDFETVLLHEVGHCIGLGHPNENVCLDSTCVNDFYTAAWDPDGPLDLDEPGIDGTPGTRDDDRGDDLNLFWFNTGVNNPFTFSGEVDDDDYSVLVGSNLPSGHSSVAWGSRFMAEQLGMPETEAVMFSDVPPGQSRRELTVDDITGILLAAAGLDEERGTADDYSIELEAVSGSDCDIKIEYRPIADSSGLCEFTALPVTSSHNVITRATIVINPLVDFFYGESAASAPEVATNVATNNTEGSASLNLSVNPNGANTTVWFDWGTTSTSLGQETSPRRNVGAGTIPVPVSITLGGLACGRTYYFRARGENAIGNASLGQTLSLETNACGSGGPQSIELIVDSSFEAGNNAWWVASPAFYIDDEFDNARTGDFYAYLTKSDGTAGNNLSGGMISPEVTIPDDATDADLRFYYSIDTQETTSSSIFDKVDVYLVRSGSQLTKVATISNLDHTGTGYVSKSVDLSSSFYGDEVQVFFAGSTDGSRPTKFRIDDVSLEVDVPSGGPPEVTTNAADQVSSSSARLNMTVDPNGADTEIWFDLEPGDSTPSDDTEHINIGAGSGNRTASISVFGLNCGTKYYFRAHAENSYDEASGNVKNFTTSACSGGAPRADTDPAENITQTSATLTADVDPNGLPTQAWFEWGENTSLGQETSHASVGSGTGNVDFSQTISGLTCGTTYYFENHAQNSAGHDDGVTLEFTTDSCDPVNLPVVTVSAVDASATENPMTSGIFSIQRIGSVTSPLTVTYGISGTAIMGIDHTLGQGTVTIPAGLFSRGLTVYPLDDFYVEGDETVVLTIQPSPSYVVGPDASATVTIVSDDGNSPMIFEDDMESGSGWNYQGTWARTQSSAHSPIHSWTDSPAGSYANNSSSRIAISGLDFTNRQSVHLSFWHRFQFDSGDVGKLWVGSASGDFPWQVVGTFWGTSVNWIPATVDLSRLAGMTQVGIAFQVVTNAAGVGDGWYIDDVSVFEPPAIPLDFYTVAPCRVMDTRQDQVPLLSGDVMTFGVVGACGIPPEARAVSFNVTAVGATGEGHITLFPADQPPPPTSSVSFQPGQNRASNALIGLSVDGRIGAGATLATGQVDLVLDVNGYFAEPAHPMVGVWEGTVASYASKLTIKKTGEAFSALLSMDQANIPVEEVEIRSISETALSIYRPEDDAMLEMTRTHVGSQECLVGEYLEPGTSRPILLCKTQ